MPKRVPDSQTVDPVRSRLAASAASAASTPLPRPVSLVETRLETTREEERREPEPESRPRAQRPVASHLTVNRKVMFTEDEAQRNADTVALISSAFGSQATYSQITRAMWSILAGAEDAIKAGGKRTRRLSVPSKGDHIAMAEYEEALAQFLGVALRRS
jgi:hypothetical protein